MSRACYSLGGGLFGDTYLGELDDRQVAAKRLNVGVHQRQLTADDMTFMVEQVRRLRSVPANRYRLENSLYFITLLLYCVGICCLEISSVQQ